ncbi:MAG: hypothetical protein Tsb0019_03300 [Roseibium sp.]
MTIGNDAISRGSFDSYNNFGLALTGVASPVGGTISNWEVFARAGTIALLVLRPTAVATDFTLVGFDARTAVNGFQSFASSLSIQQNDILGLFLGTGDVSYGLDSGPNVCGTPNCNVFFTSNGGIPALAGLVGTDIAFSAGATDRTYSVNATIVPLPASALLLVSAFGGLLLTRRFKQSA